MSALSEAAARAAVLKTLLDSVKAAYDQARRDVHAEMVEQGAERVGAALPDGTKVAQIVLTQPKPTIRIDEFDFFEWVDANHQTEIVNAPSVRPAFRTAILARLVIVGDEVFDTKTGEPVEWAHVNPAGEPYPTTKLVDGGKDAIESAWRDGSISLDALSMLEIDQ